MSLYPPDPWRALQLPRDASLEEVKAAYRRLAKRYHPDSAGESALPRFLAIQAAYESLTEGPYRLRLGTGRPAGGAGRPAGRPGRSADGPSPRPRRQAPNAGAADDRPRTGPAGPAGPNTRRGTADGSRRSTAGTSDRSYSARRPGQTSERGASGTSKSGRPRRRAKPGSTSYDEATSEPFQPDWNGGSWYGESSGTYWTINPKEYADPRKHGPEYQARARRAAADRYSMPGDRPDPETEAGPSARSSADESHDTQHRASASRNGGFSGAAVDWSAGYEDIDDVPFGPDPPQPAGRRGTDDADGLWSSPAGLIGLALAALIVVTVAMLVFDGSAIGSARPSIVWVGSAALLVIMLARVLAAARRGSN